MVSQTPETKNVWFYHHNIIVSFYHHNIFTTITKDPICVDSWIAETTRNINPRHSLIIGLGAEWRPSFGQGGENPVAILKLCSGHRCLIFQIIHARSIPPSLRAFLNNPNYTFVGVGIQADAVKLVENYDLGGVDCGQRLGGNMVDLKLYAMDKYGYHPNGLGLQKLAREFIGMEPEKSEHVKLSRWDNELLSPEQIDYASIDAFCCFEIGKVMSSHNSVI